MKKILVGFLAVVAMMFTTAAVKAADQSVAGGFEASGNILTGFGWQKYKNGAGFGAASRGVMGNYLSATNAAGVATTKAGEGKFNFFLDSVELDLAKSFGENVRFRTDLLFGATNLGSGARFAPAGSAGVGSGNNGAVFIEQAYATANFAVGNGLEFLLGRFDAPFGYEAVNAHALNTISHSVFFQSGIRPSTLTGAKFFYPFSDSVDLNFYIVNNLTVDAVHELVADSKKPDFGFRLGYSWGEEGAQSTVGLSAAGGWDTNGGALKEKLLYLADVDFNVKATDSFAVGGEVLYRGGDEVLGGGTKAKDYAALLNLNYNFSDVWDGTLQYAFTKDSGTGNSGALTGVVGTYHEIALAGGYAIADGAKFKLEANYTMLSGVAPKPSVMGLAGAFSYNF